MPDTTVANNPSSVPELLGPVNLVESNGVHSTPHPVIADQIAPAEQVAAPGLWNRLGWYCGSILLTCVLIFTGLRLDQADLNAPFYYDMDSLLILPMVKSTVEHGFGGHWHTARLGAPDQLDLSDFPVTDHIHFLLIWLLSKVVLNIGLLYNLYYLLTFPLTTLTAMLAFRHLRLTLPAAAVGGILYAFLPYHYQRWENHYFLSAYWLIPLSLMPILAICKGDFPFYRRIADGTYQRKILSWGSLGIVVVALATASGGAYYAFFTCAFCAFAGVYSVAVFRKRQAAISAGGYAALIVVFGIVNHLPSITYQAKYDRNPITDRYPKEADIYGLKITHMLLPIDDHNLRIMSRIKNFYNAPFRPAENENRSASLGIVAGVGLLGLLLSLLFPFRLGWPYGPLAALTAFGVLLATVGGFGSIFNLLVSAQIRGYNRISVFIAFFCFFATLWTIDRYLVRRPRYLSALYLSYALLPFVWIVLLPGRLVSPVWKERIDRYRDRLRARSVAATPLLWGAVLLVGFLDQTPFSWFKGEIIFNLDDQAGRFRADARFFAKVEEAMPGSKIFCLPYVSFPEYPAVYRLENYQHCRGYLHSNALSWSYGAMKGRETDTWQQEVSFRKPEEFLKRIVYRGFDGLFIDKRGYPTQREGNPAFQLINNVNQVFANLMQSRNARLPEFVHEDGQQIILDLRPFRDQLRKLSQEDFDAKVREEAEYVPVLWLNGYFAPVSPGEEIDLRYGPPNGHVWVVNPADRTRKFRMSMTLYTTAMGVFGMRLSGLVDDEFTMERKSALGEARKDAIVKMYVVEVPPGRHLIQMTCTPPPSYIPDDDRNWCYNIRDFKFEEMR